MSVTPQILDGDFVIDADKRPHFIEDKQKLIQDLSHIILTPRGDNVFHPNYGCDVPLRIGFPISQKLTAVNLQRAVVEALAYFKNIQTKQKRYQSIVGAEVIMELNSRHIFRASNVQEYEQMTSIAIDFPLPDRVRIRIAVVTEAYEEVIVPFNVYLVPRGPVMQSGVDNMRFARYNTGVPYNSGVVYR